MNFKLVIPILVILILAFWFYKSKTNNKPTGIVDDWYGKVKSAKLDEGLFNEATQEEKEELIYYFTQKIRQTDNYGDSSFQEMPKGLQVAYLINALENEVNNGGYLQFFTNSSGQYSKETLEALDLIGAGHNKMLLEKAFKILSKHNQSPENLNENINSKKFHEIINSSDFYENDELLEEMHKLDMEFYEYKENISKLKLDYIEENETKFWNEIKNKYGS